jgi:hypothetical protein
MKITLVSLLLLAGTVLAQTPTPAPTYSVKLTWTPPANATGIASYVIYDRTSPIAETKVATAPAGTSSANVSLLGANVHRFTVASVSTAGDESARSNEARVTLPAPAPAPTGVAVSP